MAALDIEGWPRTGLFTAMRGEPIGVCQLIQQAVRRFEGHTRDYGGEGCEGRHPGSNSAFRVS